jgi:two-component system, OmpR family, phosphate regulon sensor histidine kinase PhoR
LIIVLAILSVTGIFLVQFVFLKSMFQITEKELKETTTVALREVAWQILAASGQTSKFDNIDAVESVTANYYLVNVNDLIDPDILKAQMKEQFKRHNINLDYEYAIFDPEKKKMVYGDYICARGDSCNPTPLPEFPLSSRYTYYFGVNFPKPMPYVNYQLQGWYFITGLLFIVLVFFGYSMWVIIKQRQLSDIQKVFINNLTHELKTPISSIGLSAQVLSDEKIIENPGRLFEYVRIILEQSNRLAKNVEKVLNLASLEKNRLHLVTELVDLNVYLDNSIVRFRQSELGKNATISLLEGDNGSMIWADKLHFGNVIQNILENAVKYCRKIPVIEISVLRKSKKACVSFSDNGIGIPGDARKKIFRKFYRVPTGNIHDVKGFGLGLDYVGRIVKAHHWKIKVDGNKFGGSVFTIIIPLANE